MKVLKYLFFLILLLFIGVAVYFGTQKSDYSISETRTIKAPPEVVFHNINDYRNWEKWGSWMQDETVKINYPENTTGEGASYSWVSKESGDGAMKTIEAVPYSRISQKIVFNGTLEDKGSSVLWTLEPMENGTQTKVTWSMEGSLGLMEKIYFSMQDETLEESISNMYVESLANLETVLQEKMGEYSISVDGVTGHSGGYYLYNTTAAKFADIGKNTQSMLGQIQGFMDANNIPAHGSPFVAYIEWDEINNSAIFTAGIPTRDRVILPDGSVVLSGYLMATTALKTTLKGNHENLSEAWKTAEQYIVDNNLTKDMFISPFEVYTLSLPEEKNPAKWVTEIYIPLVATEEPLESL